MTTNIAKPFNLYSLVVTSSTALIPNTNNAIYFNSATDITITLPNLVDEIGQTNIIDGFIFYMRNYGAGTATLVDSSDTFITNLTTATSIILIADKDNVVWRDFLGPIGTV